ncbi:MAG: Rpn family recombination-promoting nuclease/putative transposase [Pseudanabaena sp.]
MRQVVIYLKETNSDLVYQQTYEDDTTYHKFEVIRLWEQPLANFLEFTGMLPFAILVGQGDKERLLQGIAEKINRITDLNTRETISAATYVLAGMVLEENTIKQILRRDIMEESVTYQAILREGRQEGLKEGEIKGRKQGLLTIILRQLTRKFGNLPPKLHTRIARLQIPRLESLAEAILDFESVADLELWFSKKK